MKEIKTQDAAGLVLCHDITQILPGVIKDARFRKGHIVTEEDIPVLLSMGKEHLYVWEKTEGMLHENEGAEILRDICIGPYMYATEPKEGKIQIQAECDGLLKIKRDKLRAVNAMGELVIASRHGDTVVHKDDVIAGTRVIPLMIEVEKLERAKAYSGIFSILPFQNKKTAILATGNEVFYHRIEDAFTPVIVKKAEEFSARIIEQKLCPDDPAVITEAIEASINKGAELVICTGGMSVDPDDRTPLAIRNTGAEIVSYGAPVLPGAMFLLAYHQSGVPILGLPGCVMYGKRTIFDLVLPRIMAGERIDKEELVGYGEGGLCLNCPVCTFPNCGFGKTGGDK